MIIPRIVLSVAALLVPLAAGITDLNPGGVGCVSPSGYSACYTKNGNDLVACSNFCGKSKDCLLACAYTQYAANIGCWLTSCWNQVYSCEYQGTALQYIVATDLLQTTLTLPIPYYPGPEDVKTGACSCNIGEVYGNMTDLLIAGLPRCASLVGDVNALWDCECCQASQLYSNIFGICPNSDLSRIGFTNWFAQEQKTLAYSQSALSFNGALGNCKILDTAPETCASTYGFPIKGSKQINPFELPAGIPGTQALSNLPGSVTVPPWGAVPTSLALFPAYSTAITPAAFNSKNVGATSAASGTGAAATATGSGTATGTGSGTATGTGAGSATTTTQGSGAAASTGNMGLVLAGFLITALALF